MASTLKLFGINVLTDRINRQVGDHKPTVCIINPHHDWAIRNHIERDKTLQERLPPYVINTDERLAFNSEILTWYNFADTIKVHLQDFPTEDIFEHREGTFMYYDKDMHNKLIEFYAPTHKFILDDRVIK